MKYHGIKQANAGTLHALKSLVDSLVDKYGEEAKTDFGHAYSATEDYWIIGIETKDDEDQNS